MINVRGIYLKNINSLQLYMTSWNNSFTEESSMNSSNNSDIISNTTTLGVAYTFVSVSVMIANGVIIYVIVKTHELHMNAMWMLTFRAITDFSFGLYYLVFVVPSAFLQRFAYPASLIGFASCISTLLTGQTIFNITLAVIDRFIYVIKPFIYGRIATKRNFILGIVSSISVSVIRLVMVIFPDRDFYYNTNIALCLVDFDTRMSVIASVGIPLFTLFIIIITSCVIARKMRQGRQKINHFGTNSKTENLSKFGLIVVVSVFVFCLCYSPFVISVVWNLVDKKENVPIILTQITVIAMLSNSLWNVFIYTATYRPFREALIRLMCADYYRKQERDQFQHRNVANENSKF